MQPFSPYLLIFLGGGTGSCLRFALGAMVHSRTPGTFPWGTLVVNVTGALILGMLMEGFLKQTPHPQWRMFFAIGVLGGYTTFSTLCYEAFALLEAKSYGPFAGYVLGTNLMGLTACWIGAAMMRRWAAA